MKRVFLSILIIGLFSAFAFYATSSFFSDTETSNGNIFQAGAIDLKIDNESYYNGSLNEGTTWALDDLLNKLFFNFDDLKPDDYGEDTISLHVENDAWACMKMDITKDDDGTCTEPELIDDPECDPENENQFDGELGGLVNFIWWIDDGDNVLEDNEVESVFKRGSAIEILNGEFIPLAQSQQGRILLDSDLNEDGSMIGGKDYFIGKAWCFGTIEPVPLPQDDYSGPDNDNNSNETAGEPEDGGYTCDGVGIDNASQTDILMGDIEFNAVQARHNPDFNCSDLNLLWIIGDVETSQLDNPVDELNYPGVFGVFPTPPAIGADYTRVITSPVDDTADKQFPWNTNYNSNYARNINIDFNWSGSTIPVKLSIGWSPGKSAHEQKEVFLDGGSLGFTPDYLGIATSGWWNDMPRFVDTFNFALTNGDHTIRIEHQFGDGTLWDFIKLEKL